jgi:hypothetical protein
MQPFKLLTTIFIVSTCTSTSGYVPTFEYAVLIASSTNSIYGSTSRDYIFDCSTFGSRVVSTYYCSWIVCGSFFS